MAAPIPHAALVAYLLAVFEVFAPSARTPFRDVPETPAERRARYVDTAEAYADAIEAIPDAAFPFRGKNGERAHRYLAAYAAGVTFHESGLLASVDNGTRRGDGGASFCNFQVLLGKGTTPEGWTGDDLVADRHKCALVGMRILARHLANCARLPVVDRTSGYASGHCREGVPAARRQAALVARAFQVPTPALPAAPLALPPAVPAPEPPRPTAAR